MKIRWLFFFLSLVLFSVQSQETEDTVTEDDSQQTSAVVPPTLHESRIDILRFGIESEVVEVLTSISTEKDSSYNQALMELLQGENNSDILKLVYQIFADSEFDGAVPSAMEQLQNYVDDELVDEKLLTAAMTYLGNLKALESRDLFYDILKEEKENITAYALSQIGKLGDNGRFDDLLDLFNENEEESNDIAVNVIKAWGDLKSTQAVDVLIELVEDEYTEKDHRQMAAEALGKIGDIRGMEPVNQLFRSSDDAMTRAYALSGLIHFDDASVNETLIQALRRDTFWRIRVTAAQGLAERNISEAAELLEYKLKRDPESQVKKAAAAALAKLNTSETADMLNSYLIDAKLPEAMRLEVLKAMLKEKVPGTAESLQKIFEEQWEKKDAQGKFLEYCCREASLTDWDALKESFVNMLSHHNPYIQIYGIRGLRRIEASEEYQKILDLDKDGVNGLVRREAADLKE